MTPWDFEDDDPELDAWDAPGDFDAPDYDDAFDPEPSDEHPLDEFDDVPDDD